MAIKEVMNFDQLCAMFGLNPAEYSHVSLIGDPGRAVIMVLEKTVDIATEGGVKRYLLVEADDE